MVVGLLLYTTTGGFVDALLIAPPLTTIDDSENEYLIEPQHPPPGVGAHCISRQRGLAVVQ
jgi:hypothetical protein